MEFRTFRTARLHLREITEADAYDFFGILSRRDVMRYYGMDELTDVKQAKLVIQSFERSLEENRAVRWGIIEAETDRFIGSVGLNNLQLWNKKTEVGYELHPDYWGRGYMTEAVTCIVDYCFGELLFNRIGATVYPENKASAAILLKLGFLKEGRLRNYLFQGGRSHDVEMYSLLPQEYTGRGQ